MAPWVTHTVSTVGAVLVLFAYIASGFDRMDKSGPLYAALNCVGTFLLAITLIHPFNLGAFAVESIWSAVSLVLLVRALRRV